LTDCGSRYFIVHFIDEQLSRLAEADYIVQDKMAAMWVPEDSGLVQILELLRDSQSPNNATQQAVQQVYNIHILD